jgi:signal transduction histidine kinase
MISLVPDWARHHDAFWNAVRRRNLWLIKLRYGAAIMLALLIVSGKYLLRISYSDAQETLLIILTLTILLYNFFIHWLRRFIKYNADKFNPLHLSIIQMLLDLPALMILVYITGSIESPLYMFFVFHMIIGSMILPGKVVYTMAVVVVVSFVSIVFGEYTGIITHHSLEGLLRNPVYDDIHFVLAFSVIFVFLIGMSVVLTNRIARQLYQIEQNLVESYEKLKGSEAEKQKYIMAVVHEIKTPIAALHSYLDIILQKFLGPLSTAVEEKLSRAKIRSEEAIQLIENVLKISKLRLGEEINYEQVNIDEIVRNAISKYSTMINSKNIKITITDERINKKNISGDKMLLGLAFSNLVSNAVKYVNEDGLIKINMSEKENKLVISISDNGIGIPQKDLGNIFKDFYRASNIKEKEYAGTGLGLSFVKQIIERHGGTIEVKSPSGIGNEKNPGCCFTIWLQLE